MESKSLSFLNKIHIKYIDRNCIVQSYLMKVKTDAVMTSFPLSSIFSHETPMESFTCLYGNKPYYALDNITEDSNRIFLFYHSNEWS